MPRVSKRAHRRRREFKALHILQLKTGCDMFRDAFGDRGEEDWDAMQECWEQWKGKLLPWYISIHPGERPFAWWRFETDIPPDTDWWADDQESQTSYLWRHGLLTPEELKIVTGPDWDSDDYHRQYGGRPFVSLDGIRQWMRGEPYTVCRSPMV